MCTSLMTVTNLSSNTQTAVQMRKSFMALKYEDLRKENEEVTSSIMVVISYSYVLDFLLRYGLAVNAQG